MLKILDRYIIKTFFGPFFFIFSVLFFIFIVNIIWVQLGQFMGKGLSYWQILKLLFYLGVNVISMVLPLTILLASIMSFGEFGERYELAAMKAAGIPLTRVMAPLLGITTILAIMLFFFSNNIIPDFQRKAKNMLFNIAQTKPAINFTPGQFIDQIPGYMVKFDKIYGENGENIEGVFVHKKANTYENQQSVVAEKGKFVPATNKNYLKLILYNGYVFEDAFAGKGELARLKQPDQAIKFDTLVNHFDISELINKAIEKEQITDDYRFQTYNELNSTIATSKKENALFFKNVGGDVLNQTNTVVGYMDQDNKPKVAAKSQIKLDTVKSDKKLELIYNSYNRLETLKSTLESKKNEFSTNVKYFSKIVIYQQRYISYSVTCLIFFLIGASLGSIIRKGGMGLPVIIAIVIFIIFYVINVGVENMSWSGKMNPYLAAWLPNFILLPFGIWMTFKALTDSQLFDAEKYKALFKPITKRFSKSKEHKRYQ
ncbi:MULTISPECIES: LptF/LptG family permease [unclassified Chryseobacterium]|uniref:LptF/LptG family permease n=1 Tax=unclassified Chryseobacterium TaxID=2593645 RepID=UPI000F4AABDC|nr:LptF/LptG family permease [Chryseobacterium sp. BIGb0232]MCS4302705.1 lipopolysaccharide export system permease protein [Chryseobacterium sp. BIGb0232]ROS17359.1 lipopolysaccharide export system permease protein [Chryseobacterium nakagawai]